MKDMLNYPVKRLDETHLGFWSSKSQKISCIAFQLARL